MQLRLLVGEQAESAPVKIADLKAYTGRSASSLYDHLAVLRRMGLVRQYYHAPGRLVFSFPPEYSSGKQESASENWHTTPIPVQKTGPDSGNLEKEAVKAYHATLGLRPNQAQWEAIGEVVKDLALWEATLEHWQIHRWNSKNVPGILEIYARDGPKGFRFCRKDKPATGLAALAIMREALARGEYG